MIIRSFQDVENELRKIREVTDRLNSANLDLNGRRVINAGGAQALSDYTTKQDVLDLLEGTDEKDKLFPGWLQVDFTVSTPSAGNDIAPRPVPWIPQNEKGVPILCGARLRTPATSNAFTLRWNHYSVLDDNTVDLMNGSVLTIPVNEAYATFTDFYPNRSIQTQDYFTLDIVTTGKADEEDANDTTGGAGLYTFLAIMAE